VALGTLGVVVMVIGGKELIISSEPSLYDTKFPLSLIKCKPVALSAKKIIPSLIVFIWD
jgi:hypothetical protein